MEEKFYSELIAAITKAKEAAHEENGRAEEGTCNFDTPIIQLPKCDIARLRGRDFRELNGFELEHYHDDWYFINGICEGMAMRRTAMAEAVYHSLEKSGYNAFIYYQMD